MKKKAIVIAAVILALAAGFFAYTIIGARTAAAGAAAAYNAAVQEYNNSISAYNEAASGITEANDKLQKALDAAQTVLDKGEAAYEPDTQDQLESAVQKAKKSFVEAPVQIDPLEEREVPGSFNAKDLELAQHEAETALKAVEEAKGKIPETPEVPDYAKELEAVQTAQKKYEDSVQKLANITAPSDSFVRERIEKIGTVVEAEAVTAQHDPNGLLGQNGGYIGCVYFLDERVDRNLLPQEAFKKEKEKSEESQTASKENASGASGEAATASTESAAEEAEETASTRETTAAEETAAAGETTAAEETAAAGETTAAEETAAIGDTGTAEDTAAIGETAAAAATTAAAQPAKSKENTIDVVMIGTAGGGAVEVFATEEDAKNRAEYIAFFDGSVMEAGPCEVEGTCVIRASKYLGEEEQKKLINEVREALLAVEE